MRLNERTLGRLLFPARKALLTEKIARYAQRPSREEIERLQVTRFNTMWSYCIAEVAFYRTWRAEHALPERISQPTDLAHFPVLDKQTFLNRADEMFEHGKITSQYQSGGSTGVSARYPRGRTDDLFFYTNTYLGRSWSGIKPLDPSVLIWSHDHLFGTGTTRVARKTWRHIADRVVNITRLNAYQLTDDELHRHYLRIVRTDWVYLIGYTLVMTRLAQYIQRNGLPLGANGRGRAIILTAETVDDPDIELVERVFSVPCVIEYGAGETGVMAASRGPTRPLHVFWNSFICLTEPDGALNVTTLDTRLFPLVNYAIGDRVEVQPTDPVNVLELRSIVGRLKDLVQVAGVGGELLTLSCRLPVHVLKTYPGIAAYQFDQRTPTQLHILLQASELLDLAAVSVYFTSEMQRNGFPFDPRSVTFEQVPCIVLTQAGKHTAFAPATRR